MKFTVHFWCISIHCGLLNALKSLSKFSKYGFSKRLDCFSIRLFHIFLFEVGCLGVMHGLWFQWWRGSIPSPLVLKVYSQSHEWTHSVLGLLESRCWPALYNKWHEPAREQKFHLLHSARWRRLGESTKRVQEHLRPTTNENISESWSLLVVLTGEWIIIIPRASRVLCNENRISVAPPINLASPEMLSTTVRSFGRDVSRDCYRVRISLMIKMTSFFYYSVG